METTFTPKRNMSLLFAGLILIGIAAVIAGFITDSERTWANILLNNYYFITIAMGALLFYSIQYITNSGWSAVIQRLPQALGGFLPVGGLLMLLMYFGLPYVYEWAEPGITETDKLIAHKEPFLNVPFFMIRLVLYFVVFLSVGYLLRKYSVLQDKENNIRYYQKSRYYAQVYIFVGAIFFSFASKDWVMTIDSHWFSTLFGFRNMVVSMYYGSAAVILLLLFMRSQGYFSQVNDAHLHDLGRYLFRFSIVWGYLWFMQFLIIWYANISEFTAYYEPRFTGEWQPIFYAELILNFIIPFLVMMSDDFGKKPKVLLTISIILMIGLWLNIYLQIMPGSYGPMKFGFVEAGMWLGYLGLFLAIVFTALGRALLIPQNHPYLQESLHHH
ncbi:MAG: quinol:cytochrome C oxidoreductase, partial [Bacteroidota bacterium]